MYRVKKFKYDRFSSKLHNVRKTYNGITYQSKLEAKYAMDLDLLMKSDNSDIKEWIPQVKISLDINGEHICNYYIDFVIEYNDGRKKYVEVKGLEMPLWRLKWRLFLALYKDQIESGEIEVEVVK